MFRRRSALEVLLVHPGGPFWAKKDEGVWSIPKGEPGEGEEALDTARREFEEETSFRAEGPFLPLGSVRQKGGKVVQAWAFAGDCDPALLRSNTCEIEWPPRSGRRQTIPEVDRAEWFDLAEARRRINPAQAAFLDVLETEAAHL
jgi:predicted NUDIX family NTP pyrophosphohydrolase